MLKIPFNIGEVWQFKENVPFLVLDIVESENERGEQTFKCSVFHNDQKRTMDLHVKSIYNIIERGELVKIC